MRFVIDMNLSPDWRPLLTSHGWTAEHWCELGDAWASDVQIMEWARHHEAIILTHDLDFGTLLAIANASGPSVIQLRARDVMPQTLGAAVVSAIKQHQAILSRGALMVIEPARFRVRLLPLNAP